MRLTSQNLEPGSVSPDRLSSGGASNLQVLAWNASLGKWAPVDMGGGSTLPVTTELLKGDGAGGAVAAAPSDYVKPGVDGSVSLDGDLYVDGTVSAQSALAVNGLQIAGLPSSVLRTDASGIVGPAVAGTDYLEPDGDGSALTGVDAAKIGGTAVDTALPADGKVLTYDGTAGKWTAKDPASSLPDLAPDPSGSFTSANITVDKKGRITAAANGSSGAALPSTSELLKGNGSGGAVAAVGGTDYLKPSGDGSGLTNVNAKKIAAVEVDTTTPTDGQVLTYEASSSKWKAKAAGGGGSAPANMVTTDTVQTVTGAKTLTGGLIVGGRVAMFDKRDKNELTLSLGQVSGWDQREVAMRFLSSSATGLSSITLRIKKNTAANAGDYRIALWSDVGGNAGSILGSDVRTAFNAALNSMPADGQWREITVPLTFGYTLAAATYYWITVAIRGVNATHFQFAYGSDTGGGSYFTRVGNLGFDSSGFGPSDSTKSLAWKLESTDATGDLRLEAGLALVKGAGADRVLGSDASGNAAWRTDGVTGTYNIDGTASGTVSKITVKGGIITGVTVRP